MLKDLFKIKYEIVPIGGKWTVVKKEFCFFFYHKEYLKVSKYHTFTSYNWYQIELGSDFETVDDAKLALTNSIFAHGFERKRKIRIKQLDASRTIVKV